MIGLDTNVLVRYLTQDDAAMAPRANAVVDGLTDETPGFIPTLVFAELFWVLTRAYRWPSKEAAATLAELPAAQGIVAESAMAVEAAGIAAQRGVDFADALIAFATRRAGCAETVTFDAGAAALLGWKLL